MDTNLCKGGYVAKIEKDAPEPEEDFNALLKERGLSRRSFIKSTSAWTAAVMLPPLCIPSAAKAAASPDNDTFVYVGNFAAKPSSWETPPTAGKGFGIFRYNQKTGELQLIQSAVLDRISVGATCLDAKRNILYCNDERMTHAGSGDDKGSGGLVYALAINPKTGDLTEINHRPSHGSLPSYPAVDATGKYLIVSHHTGNTPVSKMVKDASGKYRSVFEYDDVPTVLFRLNDDGSIGDPCDAYMHSGNGPDPEQTHPRIHSVMMSPSGNLFAACDKGGDRLFFFRINRKTEKLEVCGGEGYKTFSGSLPRYSVFHPTRPYFYMNHEVKPVISAFRYDEDGKLEFIHAVDVLPEDSKVDRTVTQSDIRIHPSGKYLYDLIRGLDVVSVLAVKETTGRIERIQTVKLDGTGPRGCAISPDGMFLYAATATSQKVVVWAIGEDGKVSPTGKNVSQPSPGNVTFFRA
jgi:6-phosphogluconolactonase